MQGDIEAIVAGQMPPSLFDRLRKKRKRLEARDRKRARIDLVEEFREIVGNLILIAGRLDGHEIAAGKILRKRMGQDVAEFLGALLIDVGSL